MYNSLGSFVSRHLGLVGCNIVLMKHFLPLLILTGLLFGQDTTLVLKDGRTITGTIVSETEYEYTVRIAALGYDTYGFEKIKILKSDIVTIESEDVNKIEKEYLGISELLFPNEQMKKFFVGAMACIAVLILLASMDFCIPC